MRKARLAVGCSGLLSLLGLASPAGAQQLPSDPEPAEAHEWQPADDERRSPHHVRSFVEMGAGLALGAAGYWLLKDANALDWDNPAALGRFDGSAWVVDNNPLQVNFLGHPMWGSLSYSFARANHQSVLGSYGYAFLTSFLWEFGLEYKEKVSFNDVLVTPTTAVPIGEFFYKLGQYLDTGERPSFGLDLARWLLGTGVALDRSLDGRPRPSVKSRDNLGLSRAIWHEFRLEAAVLAADAPGPDNSYALYQTGFSGRLVSLPGYLRPRSFERGFYRAEVADFSLAVEGSRYGMGLQVEADAILAGYHRQRLTRQGQGALRGHALTLGTSLGYYYFRSSANRYPSVEDAVSLPAPDIKYHHPNPAEQYAALNLPGLTEELRWFGDWGKLGLSGRLQPSFAGLMASAFYDWAAVHPDEVTKHILHAQGYFYGWGPATSLDARLALGPLRAGFELMYGVYWSQQGLDRHAEELTVDVPVWGDVLFYRGTLGVSPPGSNVDLSLAWGVRRFRSEVGGYERTARSIQRGVTASWSF